MIELTELCGDAGALLDYRLTDGQLQHRDDPGRIYRSIANYCVEITCQFEGMSAELREAIFGLPAPPPPAPRLTRTELAALAAAALVTLAWTLALLWFAFGIVDATMNGATTR